MAETLASDQVTLAKVIDGGDIPEELVQEIHDASTNAAEAKTDAAQAGIAATTAKNTAEAAQAAATDAAKTATNYMEETEGALIVHPPESLDSFVRIDEDSFDIYQDGEQIAEFGTINVDGIPFTKIESKRTESRGILLLAEPLGDNYYGGNSSALEITGDGANGEHSANIKTFSTADDDTLIGSQLIVESDQAHAEATLRANADDFEPDSYAKVVVETWKAEDPNDYSTYQSMVSISAKNINLEADEVALNRHNIECVGECVTLSGNAGQITLSTSAANYLTGRSAIWGKSSNYDKVYDISLNPAVIKVKQAGMYLVKIAAYFTTGFTVNDLIHVNIEKQTSGTSTWATMGVAAFLERVNNASYYRQIDSIGYLPLEAGDSIRMTAYNQTAARGQIYVNGYTNLQIMKMY